MPTTEIDIMYKTEREFLLRVIRGETMCKYPSKFKAASRLLNASDKKKSLLRQTKRISLAKV